MLFILRVWKYHNHLLKVRGCHSCKIKKETDKKYWLQIHIEFSSFLDDLQQISGGVTAISTEGMKAENRKLNRFKDINACKLQCESGPFHEDFMNSWLKYCRKYFKHRLDDQIMSQFSRTCHDSPSNVTCTNRFNKTKKQFTNKFLSKAFCGMVCKYLLFCYGCFSLRVFLAKC